jgi:hypothetical protein
MRFVLFSTAIGAIFYVNHFIIGLTTNNKCCIQISKKTIKIHLNLLNKKRRDKSPLINQKRKIRDKESIGRRKNSMAGVKNVSIRKT